MWANPTGYKHVHKGASALDHGPEGDRWNHQQGRPGTAAELHRSLSPHSGGQIMTPSDNTSFREDYERDREHLRFLKQEAAKEQLQRKLREGQERYNLSPGGAEAKRQEVETQDKGIDTGMMTAYGCMRGCGDKIMPMASHVAVYSIGVGHDTIMELCPDGHGDATGSSIASFI